MEILWHLFRGDWAWGWRAWQGKPKLWMGREWYDGWHYVLHIGPFWIECDY